MTAESAWQPTHRHYKGNLYRVIGEAMHTETQKTLVIYENRAGLFFARPIEMFKGTVEQDGRTRPRFAPLDLALAKRPTAFRVKDHADGWIYFDDEVKAIAEAEATGALVQALYVRDGS